MTAPATKRPRSTALARIAGVLFVVSAAAHIGGEIINDILENRLFSGQGDTDPEFLYLGPTIVLGVVGIGALFLAFVLLFAWLPITLPNSVFLALAISIPFGYVLGEFAGTALVWGVVYAAISLFAGVSTVVRRVFARGTSILFLIAMLLMAFQSSAVLAPGFWYGSLWFESAVSYAGSVALLGFGVALVIWPRTRSVAA